MIVTINSSHGHCTADTYSGVMLEDHLDESFGAKPICFNFAEWRRRYPGKEPKGSIDILDLGFIATNGEYCAPEEGWRKDREKRIQEEPKPYTVILQYPDYCSDDDDYYVAWVEGPTRDRAIHVARNIAAQSCISTNDPTDFAVVGVIEGHHTVYGE